MEARPQPREGGVMSAPANATNVNEVVLLREDCISVGRPLALVVGPILDSILDTIFWGDGYKSLAHVVFLTFGWCKGFVGLRFMLLLLYCHVVGAVVVSTRRRQQLIQRKIDEESLARASKKASPQSSNAPSPSSPVRSAHASSERREALFAYRATTAYVAYLVETYPYFFFVLPQGENSDRRKLHTTVAGITSIILMVWFPAEARFMLNKVIYCATAFLGGFGLFGSYGVEELLPLVTVYEVLDVIAAPVAILTIAVGGLGKVGPRDPRVSAPSNTKTFHQKKGPNDRLGAVIADSGTSVVGSSLQTNALGGLQERDDSMRRRQIYSSARQEGGSSSSYSLSVNAASKKEGGVDGEGSEEAFMGGAVASADGGQQARRSPSVRSSTEITVSGGSGTLSAGERALEQFLTSTRMDQLLGGDFSFDGSQTRRDVLMPLARAVCPSTGEEGGSLAMPYWMHETPYGEWDTAVARVPALPTHAHKILALLAKGPNWTPWKRIANKPERKPLPGNGDGRNPIADAENLEDDVVVLNHPTGFSQVKCGFNRVRVRGIRFDDVITWLCDDMFKENGEPAKATKDLNVFKYDVFLSEYRRLAYHTYTINTPDGPVSGIAKVIHFLYKQMVIGVAARDVPMFTTARELTESELRHYGLFGEHATTFYPNRVRRDGSPQPLGRVFLISSSPAANVPPAPGHVKATIHRHAVLVIAPPKKSECGDADDDEHDIVDICTMMCGEPGGRIPSFAVEIGRGEQLKVVTAIYNNIVSDMKAAGQCTYADNHKK